MTMLVEDNNGKHSATKKTIDSDNEFHRNGSSFALDAVDVDVDVDVEAQTQTQAPIDDNDNDKEVKEVETDPSQNQNQNQNNITPPSRRRRMFRKMMNRIGPMGFFVAFVSYLLFFLLMITFSIGIHILLKGNIMYEAGPIRILHFVFQSGWIGILGFGWTYLLPILGGRKLYFAVTGYSGCLALICHLTVALIGVFGDCQNCLHHDGEITREEMVFMCIYLLLCGLYIFLMRSTHAPLLQLRDLYKFKGKDGKPIVLEDPIPRDDVEMLLGCAIRHLDLQQTISASDVDLCNIRKGPVDGAINHNLDWSYIVESLSQHVGFLPSSWCSCCSCCSWCSSSRENKKKPLTPGQYMHLTKELHCLIGRYVCGEHDENTKTRLTPWSSFEVVTSITSKWLAAPWELCLTLLSIIAFATVMPLQALFMGQLVDYATSDQRDKAAFALVAWSFTLVLNGPIGLLMAYAHSRLNSKAIAIIRDRIFRNLINGGTKFANRMGEGQIMDTFSSQLGKLEFILITATFTLLLSVLELLMGIVFAFRVSPIIAVLFACLLPVMYSIDGIAKHASNLSKRAASQEADVATKFNSIVNCLPVIETCHSEEWVSDGFRPAKTKLYNARKESNFGSSLLQIYYLSCGAFYSACVLIPWGLALIDGYLTPGQFVEIVVLCKGMCIPLERLGSFMRIASNYSGALQRVDDFIARGEEEEKRKKDDLSSNDLKELKPLEDHVEVKGVTFRYPGSDVDVLKGININLSKGKYITLFGTSGAGKSTLLDIVMRNRPCRSGSVKWDGHNIVEATVGSFRKEVAVMFQRTMILQPWTIRDNITFGAAAPVDVDDVSNCDRGQIAIEEAAKMAEIHDFICSLPDGYDTVLGDGVGGGDGDGDGDGTTRFGLSGGQLQRICLARALYRKPSVLLLDEATSSLDPISQAAIVKTFVKLCHEDGLTIFSISHQPSTAADADKIVVLDEGVVAEEGSYDDLATIDGGIFRAMIEAAEKKDDDDDDE